MEVKNLLESSNSYKSLQADAAKLADKWQASGLLEGIQDVRHANNMKGWRGQHRIHSYCSKLWKGL
jgi:hypothetical protein